MGRITRTDKEAREFPEVPLVAGLSRDGMSGFITGQEAQGQRELVASAQLPREGLMPRGGELGVAIVGDGGSDPLFAEVTMPQGWTKRPTDHSMWSDFVDAEGRRIASIFYKAAFYDRSAFIRWERWLSIEEWAIGDKPGGHATGATDCAGCCRPPTPCACGRGLMHRSDEGRGSIYLRCDFCRANDWEEVE